MKMIAVSSALTGLAKVWIRHRRLIEIWGTCTTHHLLYQTSSVSFLRGHPVVCRADSVLSQPLCSDPVHHQALTAPTFEYLETPVNSSLCLDTGLFMETAQSRYQWASEERVNKTIDYPFLHRTMISNKKPDYQTNATKTEGADGIF